MATYAFAGGVNPQAGWGDRWKMGFSGTWVEGENWTFTISTADSIFTIGVGQLGGLASTYCSVLANRVFLGQGTRFNGSANTDPTKWEQQDPGAMFEDYRSQYGVEDTIYALASMQGRLIILAGRTIQSWTANADPAQFNLVQVLDNIGTTAKGSVQQLGDYDVLFVDPTGVRSVRSRELTLNAFVTDIGSPVDELVQASLVGIDQSGICSVVEPATKRYWVFINDRIYVLSYYPALKITAWSTYIPTAIVFSDAVASVVAGTQTTYTVVAGTRYYWAAGPTAVSLTNGTETLTTTGYFLAQGATVHANHVGIVGPFDDGTVQSYESSAFTPSRFFVHQGLVYCRDTNGNLYQYGGGTGNIYDLSVCAWQIPWLDAKTPNLKKTGVRINCAMEGAWQVEAGMDPRAATDTVVVVPYQVPVPSSLGPKNSTFDEGSFPLSGLKGTHFTAKGYTSPTWGNAATFGAITFQYNKANET